MKSQFIRKDPDAGKIEGKRRSGWWKIRWLDIIIDLVNFKFSLHTLWKFIFMHFISVAQSCPSLCDPMNRSTPGLPVHHHLPEFTQTHVHEVGDAIQPSHPLSSPFPPVPNPSQHQSLSNESTLCMRCPRYWSFSFSIIPSKEHPGLILFRMDWLDLLAYISWCTLNI